MFTGNWGNTFFGGRPVLEVILERMPATFLLMGTALALAVTLGIGIGMLGALRRHSLFDYLASTGAMVALSFPTFWFGLMAIFVFAVRLGWLPSGGMYELGEEGNPIDLLRHLILPASVLALVITATYSRYARSAFIEVMHQDFMRTARAKGLRPRRAAVPPRISKRDEAADRAAGNRPAAAVLGCAGCRNDLRLARDGPPVRRCPDDEGISDLDGHDHVHRDLRHRRQSARRRRDRLARSAGAACMSATLTLTSPRRPGALRRFSRHRMALFGAVTVLLLLLCVLFAPAIAPHDPLELDTHARFLPPLADLAFPLGTDELGRDLLSRLLYGGRISLVVGIVAMLTTVVTGASIGLLSGYYGGWTDTLLMRFVDTMLCFPQVFLLLCRRLHSADTALHRADYRPDLVDGGRAHRARRDPAPEGAGFRARRRARSGPRARAS